MKAWNIGLRLSLYLLFLSVSAAQTSLQPGEGPISAGVVVEKVIKNFEAEKTGIQEGDILLRWVRADIQREIRSPFDLTAVEIEQAPRGAITVEGLRDTEKKTWRLGQDTGGIRARPNFSSAFLTSYLQGQDLATAGKLNAAAESWRALASQPMSSDPHWLRIWLVFYVAELQEEGRHWQECDQAYQEALAASTAQPDVIAQVQRGWGRTFLRRNDWVHAEEHLRPALAAGQEAGTKSLGLALALEDLGKLAHKRGDLP